MNTDLVLSPILIAVILGTLRIFVKKRWMNLVELLFITIATIFVLVYQRPTTFVVGGWSSAIGIEIKYDTVSFWFVLSLLIVWASVKVRFEKWESIVESLVDYLFASLFALFISNDLFNIYVTIELTSLISFLLAGHGKNPSRIWAALKYMFLSSIALNLYLFGVIIVYSNVGVLSIGALRTEKVPEFGLIFILSALMVKSGAFGLSAWVIDVYSKSETSVSMILSGAVVNAGLFGVIRIYPLLSHRLKVFVLAIGVISAFGGAAYAISEKKVKKVLAFSTFSQMGIAFMALSISPLASAIYAFSHSNAKALLFSRNDKISATIGALSLIGIFPLAGYYAKVPLGENFPYFSMLMVFLTSVYIVKVLEKDLKWKISAFEIPLEFALISLAFFMPLGNINHMLEIYALAAIGMFLGKKISFPSLGDPFGLEEGIAYQLAFLSVMAVAVVK